jgi:glycosyltransferase involved in cell wall biosynthesis
MAGPHQFYVSIRLSVRAFRQINKEALERRMRGAPIVVTVLIVTYNHARFVAAAIESALSQTTDFEFEIIVSEDCSTDGTREIVQAFEAANPSRLKAIYSSKNVRSNEVVARGLRIARGRYIAMLDGDDKWTSSNKLQSQADYLEAHPEISAIFNNAVVAVGDEFTARRWTNLDDGQVVTREMIWQGNPFATCAGMMRIAPLLDVPAWYAEFFPITDWPLYVLCARAGNIAFFDVVVGAYRIHEGGLVSSKPDSARQRLIGQFYRRMIKFMPLPDSQFAREGCCRYFYDWSKSYVDNNDTAMAASCFYRCIRSGGIGLTVSRHDALRLGMRILKAMVLKNG